MIIRWNRLLLQLRIYAVLRQRQVLDPETQLRQCRRCCVFSSEGPLQHLILLLLLLSRRLHQSGPRLPLTFIGGLVARRRLLARLGYCSAWIDVGLALQA